MASNYDFRILINTIDGTELSYGSASLVSVQPNTSLVVNTDDMVDKINSMKLVQYFNGKTHTTASSLFDVKGFTTFTNTNIDGGSTDYQYLSASIKGNSDSGSILFHANNTPTAGGDYIKRYKFFGNKVCNVLGVPENYWIYVDKFRFTNTGSEQNYISGDVLAQSLHLRDNFAISNAGAIESDLPMKHAKDTDRWKKWTDVTSSIPQNDMLIGYSNQSNEYMIRMQNNKNLIISSSATTASGDFKVEGNVITTNIRKSSVTGTNNISMNVDDRIDLKPNNTVAIRLSSDEVVLNKDTEVKGDITASGDISSSNNIFAIDITATDMVQGGRLSSLGNTTFGNSADDTHVFTGNITTNGDISASNGIISDARYDKIRIVSENIASPHLVPTPALINVISEAGDMTSSNALSESASNPENYHILLKREDNTTSGRGPGIAFASSTGDTNVGAAIIHERLGSNSKGNLQFFVKKTTAGGGAPTKVMSLNSDTLGAFISGSVGINQETPTKALHINNSGILIDGGSFIDSSEPSRFVIDTGGSPGHTPMELRSTHGTLFRVNGNPDANDFVRVGIGNNTPTKPLTVQGDISQSGHFYRGNSFPCFHAVLNSDFDTGTTNQYNPVEFENDDFGNVAYDIGGNYDTTTYKFTAPVNGVYLFSTKLTITMTDDGFDEFAFGFKTDSGGNERFKTLQLDMNEMFKADSLTSANEAHSFFYTRQIKMSANDTCQVVFQIDDGDGKFLHDGGDHQGNETTTHEGCYFQGHLITAV